MLGLFHFVTSFKTLSRNSPRTTGQYHAMYSAEARTEYCTSDIFKSDALALSQPPRSIEHNRRNVDNDLQHYTATTRKTSIDIKVMVFFFKSLHFWRLLALRRLNHDTYTPYYISGTQ